MKHRFGCAHDWKTALMAAIVLSMFTRLLLLLFPLYEERWKFFFNLACVALIGPVLGMTDVGRERGMRVLIAAFLWIAVVCVLRANAYTDPELLATYLLTAAVSVFLLYPAAFVLAPARANRLLAVASAVFITGVFALAMTMLAAAFSGVYLASPGGVEAVGAGVYAPYRRLQMFCNSISAGLYCALSLLLVPFVWRALARRRVRFLLLPVSLVLFTALAASDARTPSWAFCICAGGAAYLISDVRLPVRKGFARLCLSVFCAVIAAAGCYALMRLVASLLNPLIPGLDALRAADSRAGTLTGRTDVWAAALRMLRENPSVLWTGAGPFRGMGLVQAYFTLDDTVLSHAHSIVLQTVVTLGLPGLALFGAFAGYVCFHAARLFFSAGGNRDFFERLLPLPLVLCLIVDLIETFLSFSGAGDFSNPWFFLIAGYVVQRARTKPSVLYAARAPIPE